MSTAPLETTSHGQPVWRMPLKQKYGAAIKTVDLIPGSGGAFEVSLNGTLLYSKLETGQFPTTEQITSAMDAAA